MVLVEVGEEVDESITGERLTIAEVVDEDVCVSDQAHT